jgi:regulatory protein
LEKSGKSSHSDTQNLGQEPRSIRRAAMDCLARREHSFFELTQKLQKKFPDRGLTEILQTLEHLKAEDLQSDNRFVESFVRIRKSRGFGIISIRESLKKKLISTTVIEQHLFSDDEDWDKILRDQIQRKLRNIKKLEFGNKEHLRLVRFLEGRGFPHSAIKKTLQAFFT